MICYFVCVCEWVWLCFYWLLTDLYLLMFFVFLFSLALTRITSLAFWAFNINRISQKVLAQFNRIECILLSVSICWLKFYTLLYKANIIVVWVCVVDVVAKNGLPLFLIWIAIFCYSFIYFYFFHNFIFYLCLLSFGLFKNYSLFCRLV